MPPMRAYCRTCDATVDASGAWPGACDSCRSAIEAHAVPDVVSPRLRVLFVGINPGVATARARQHFANPRNAFWTALHESGLVPRRLEPHEQEELPRHGLGITNAVTRATPGSADVTKEDVMRGSARLATLVRKAQPAMLAFVGKEAYRMATGRKDAPLGENAPWEGARTFVLPSTSPRNAHWTWDEKVAWFGRLRSARDGADARS